MKSTNLEHISLPQGTLLYRFNGVPVVAKPGFWPLPILVTGFLAYVAGLQNPERSWLQRLGVGLLALPVAMFADIGHAMAHTVSAQLAGAPMDEILLSSEMPRTLYQNNAVPPQAHIGRALGGPVFSLTCVALSWLWRSLSPKGSLSQDLADASLAGHSIILVGSLAPLPMVDGGTILKWKLVSAGQSPEQADRTVRKTSLYLGTAFLSLGILSRLRRKHKLMSSLLAAGGAAGVAAGAGWLK